MTDSPLIVGIGASVGGLESFTKLFTHLPNDTGMCFVIVQHICTASILPQILSSGPVKMPVDWARFGTVAEPNHVYVNLPRINLNMSEGIFCPVQSEVGERWIIDHFFNSLAQHQKNAIGIVLSGESSDGCIGIENIKHAGGITFAEDPSSAISPETPRLAINTSCIDFVMSLKEMAGKLISIAEERRAHQETSPPRAD